MRPDSHTTALTTSHISHSSLLTPHSSLLTPHSSLTHSLTHSLQVQEVQRSTTRAQPVTPATPAIATATSSLSALTWRLEPNHLTLSLTHSLTRRTYHHHYHPMSKLAHPERPHVVPKYPGE